MENELENVMETIMETTHWAVIRVSLKIRDPGVTNGFGNRRMRGISDRVYHLTHAPFKVAFCEKHTGTSKPYANPRVAHRLDLHQTS